MLHSHAHPSGMGALLGEIGWGESLAGLVAIGVIALLAWLLWRAQQAYAIELAEQTRLIAEEKELAARAMQDRDALARESQAKSEMLATLSREIRAHLNGIIGSADLMFDHSLKPSQREHLVTLRASAESLHQSLNDVLDYSSIETGQIQIAVAPFDLREPLIEVVETLSPLALLKKLELVLIVAPDVPLQVSGDAARVRQILFNLMSNAVKFTARGRVVLRVELSQGSVATSKNGATWLHFSVSDTGAGIPEAVQSTIFDRNADADATSRKFGGSGLELAISKRLVELMGGQIGARSLPEGGSEFWTVLALSVAREQPPTLGAAADRRHVVVLDNLAASRIAASALLARLGINHDATDSVAKAAVLLREAQEEGAAELALLLDASFARDNASGLASLLAPESPVRTTRFVLMAQQPEALPAFGPEFPVTAVLRKPLLRVESLLEALRAQPGAGALRPSGSRTPFEMAAESAPAVHHGPHVLVVDDDAISRSVSSQLLERLDCVVEVALSGTEAVTLARTSAYDLIFMDCQMPEMDGFVATEKIRAAAGGKAPPIVALTANISEADREKCFAVGMCDFVGKPVNRTELARVLKRWTKTAAPAAT